MAATGKISTACTLGQGLQFPTGGGAGEWLANTVHMATIVYSEGHKCAMICSIIALLFKKEL